MVHVLSTIFAINEINCVFFVFDWEAPFAIVKQLILHSASELSCLLE